MNARTVQHACLAVLPYRGHWDEADRHKGVCKMPGVGGEREAQVAQLLGRCGAHEIDLPVVEGLELYQRQPQLPHL